MKALLFLQEEMNTPSLYGWFHILWIIFIIAMSIILYKKEAKKT